MGWHTHTHTHTHTKGKEKHQFNSLGVFITEVCGLYSKSPFTKIPLFLDYKCVVCSRTLASFAKVSKSVLKMK
jgi:hypothetical protein